MVEPAPAAPPFVPDQEERDFQDATRLLVAPPSMQQPKTRLFLGSLLAFVGVSLLGSHTNPVEIATLIGVILFHELGHMIAMRLVGYRDVRIFFIPFFGGAAAGTKRGVARWKEGLVLLCGPLPGIVVGGVLAYVGGGELVRVIALQLIVINAINLLPVAPLDGGQLFQVLLFSRQRHLELVFVGLTAGLLAVAGLLTSNWMIAVVGFFVLVSIPHRRRVLDVAFKLRDRGLPSDPVALDEAQRRELYRAAMDSLPGEWRARWRGKPQPQAQLLEQVLERATLRPVSGAATAAQLGLWVAGLLAAFVGLWLAIGPSWRPYTDEAGRFAIDMPAAPVTMKQAGMDAVTAQVRRRQYAVLWNDVPDPVAAIAAARANVAWGSPVTDVTTTPSDRVLTYRQGETFMVVRLVATQSRLYMIMAGAPDDEPDSHRFVSSFRAL